MSKPKKDPSTPMSFRVSPEVRERLLAAQAALDLKGIPEGSFARLMMQWGIKAAIGEKKP